MGEMLMRGGEPQAGRSSITLPKIMSDRSLMQYAFDRFEMHENFLAEKLLAFLRLRPSIRIIGMPFVAMNHCGMSLHRVATICFVTEGLPSPAIVLAMDRVNIGIRFGHFYAKRLIEYLDLNKYGGVVRVSMAHYNTIDEVEALIHHLDQILPSE
jgi:selenocysteine lyase/cysteine desulfurase